MCFFRFESRYLPTNSGCPVTPDIPKKRTGAVQSRIIELIDKIGFLTYTNHLL